MRLLTYNIDEKLLDYIDNEQLYIVDIADDISDAVYHSEVRYYNLVLVDCNNYYECKNILRNVDNRVTAVIFLVDDYSKQLEVSLLNKGAISIIKKPASNDYILAKIESIHRDNFKKELFYKDNYKACLHEKALISDEKKVFFKGKSFSILSYLIKNRYRAPISKDELLQANWDEPEMVSDNVIEVNINSIRNSLKKEFNENFIETVRHRGYKVSI